MSAPTREELKKAANEILDTITFRTGQTCATVHLNTQSIAEIARALLAYMEREEKTDERIKGLEVDLDLERKRTADFKKKYYGVIEKTLARLGILENLDAAIKSIEEEDQ